MQITPEPLADEEFVPLPERIAQHAACRPRAAALIADGNVLPWGTVAARMAAGAERLAAAGVVPGTPVVTCAGVTPEHVIAYLAIIAAGGCAVPLPISATSDAIDRMVDDCGARIVLADASGEAASAGQRSIGLDDLVAPSVATMSEVAADGPAIDPDAAFDIIYSSGTTGAPKGIEHSHRFRARQLRRLEGLGIDETARALVSTPIYSNTTLALLLPILSAGGCAVLMRKFDEARFLSLAERERITHAMLVPVQYRRLLDHPGFDNYDLSAFKAKLSTSAPLPAPLIERILERWPGRMINIYGMTEGGVGALLDCGAHPGKRSTVGCPVAGSELRIIDEEGAECPPGVTGEIVGRSITMMSGYRNDAERTRAALWIAPDGRAFMRSGDTGFLDADGFLVLRDRNRDMINSGGFNIFPADLEEVLCAHPEVAEAAVIAVPSQQWGETPLAFVVPRHGCRPDPNALRDWANARLGKTQKLSAVELRDSLPRSEIGKLLKRELRRPYWPDRA